MHDIICVRSDQRVLESWTFLKFLHIDNREGLCLKPLPPFSSHLNETCYNKFLCRADVHHILVWGLTYRVSKVMPLFWNSNMHNRESVSNFIHSFQVIPMKLATSNLHEESMFITYWGLTQRFHSYAPFSKLWFVNIEKVSQSSSIVFKSSTWFSICFGLSFVTQRESEVYLSQWMIAELFLTSKTIFQNSYLQFTTSIWAVWKWIIGLPKQLKSRSFRVPSAPPGPLTKALPWTHRGYCSPRPPASFSGF